MVVIKVTVQQLIRGLNIYSLVIYIILHVFRVVSTLDILSQGCWKLNDIRGRTQSKIE